MVRSRRFLRGIALLAFTALTAPAAADSLSEGFDSPPSSARPRVWWHWMNGNITEEGIKLDLEWMQKVGIGGVQNFDAQLATPQVVDKRLVYMTPEWKRAFRFAAQTASNLGLEMAIAGSPGWSESGGPWVAPQDGMKKLVWSETEAVGGIPFRAKLQPPPSATGPFQDMLRPAGLLDGLNGDHGKTPPEYYRDTSVVAYRDKAAPLPSPLFSTSSGKHDFTGLADGRYADGIEIQAGTKASPAWLRADFDSPQTVRSATLALPSAKLLGTGPFAPILEASDDGIAFREIARIPNGTSPQYTVSFPATTAKAFRIKFVNSDAGSALPSPPAKGVDFSPMASLIGGAPASVKVFELRFHGEARVHRAEEKAAFALAPNYYAIATPRGSGVPLTDVIDLSGKMRPDGTLDWTPPPGRWKVLRFGYSLIGTENHPATPEATGLEVDKFDPDAVRRYINTYLDSYVGAAGQDLIGKRGVQALLNDSIEAGTANWTGSLMDQFRQRRGYDATPWLPALTGVIIDTAEKTDAFLYDFRATLAELIAEAHYGTIAAELHKRSLLHYSEALEAGRPSIGDDMAMRRHADIPMAAMWTYPAEEIGPDPSIWGDIRGAASVAHVYGQNLVAAESLTSMMQYWSYAPSDLQPMIDMEFALGVNRPVIHTSVHQPLTEKAPGLSLWTFGQFFNRLENWADMAKPWVTYMSRNAYMLQQGRFAADVAYFYGEEGPITAQYQGQLSKDVPTTTGFDYVNADALINELSNDDSDVVARSGARYKLIYLGGASHRMTLRVLRKLDALVRGGATVAGLKPTDSPSLSDDPAEFSRLSDRLWGGDTGKGRVLVVPDINEALASLNIAPDFEHSKPATDTAVMFVHRKLSDADIYFFTNRKNRSEALDMTFRTIGLPEYWDAETGRKTPLSYRIESGRTIIPMQLRPHQSGFVVFQDGQTVPSARTVAAPKVSTIGQIDGDWRVTFQSGRGVAPGTYSLPASDWSKNQNGDIKYFSGIATYSRTLNLPGTTFGKGKRVYLDLGEVGNVAEVLVNGQPAGIAWKAPYRVDLTDFVTKGRNSLQVRVANLWVNRLVGDVQPGSTPIGYTTVKTYAADAPLRPSGLIGPVKLDMEAE